MMILICFYVLETSKYRAEMVFDRTGISDIRPAAIESHLAAFSFSSFSAAFFSDPIISSLFVMFRNYDSCFTD